MKKGLVTLPTSIIVSFSLVIIFLTPCSSHETKASIKSEPKKKHEEIKGKDLKKYMREIVYFSSLSRIDGDLLWGRQVGTKYERMASEYVKNHFEKAKLDKVWQEECPIREVQWTPTDVELTLIGRSSPAASAKDLQFRSIMASVDARTVTPVEGIEAEIIDIGYGTQKELKEVDLKGKIALVHRDARYSIFLSYFKDIEQTRFINQNKAIGAVFAIHRIIPSNNKVAAWHGPRARKIPHVNIGSDDAKYLQKVIQESKSGSPPRVRLKVRGKFEENLRTQNIYGLIHGTNRDEYMVLIAHTDAWFEGAIDNASGLSILIALSKYFAALPRESIKRNILFVATAGHHNGPATGTFHMVYKNQDILKKTVILVNLEHFASVGPTINGATSGIFEETEHILFDTHDSPFIQDIVKKAAKEQGTPMRSFVLKRYVGDMGPFQFIGPHGVPCFALLQPTYWYHTNEDTTDRIPKKSIENAARTLVQVLDLVNSATTEEIQKDWNPPVNRLYRKSQK